MQERRRKDKGPRKYLKKLQSKTSLTLGKANSHLNPGSMESPIQDKLKEEHAKTNINQTNKKN